MNSLLASLISFLFLLIDAEAAALGDVEAGEIEAVDVQDTCCRRSSSCRDSAPDRRQVRDTVTPASSSDISSLRRLLVPPRLVCAVSARTRTPRETAAASAWAISKRSSRKIRMSMLFFACLMAVTIGGDAGIRLDDQFHKRAFWLSHYTRHGT